MKRAKFLSLLAVIAAVLAWPKDDPFNQPPPPEVEEALRSRIAQFYNLFEKSKFREAEQFVAEESRDIYYAVQKGRIFGFRIGKINFGPDFKTAKVVMILKAHVPFANSGPVDVPLATQWAQTGENWFLVLPPPLKPGDQIQTPFGIKTIKPEEGSKP